MFLCGDESPAVYLFQVLRRSDFVASFYRFHKQHRLLIVSCVGLYSPAEAQHTIAAYLHDPDFDPDHNMIIDLSQATDTDASYQEMQELAQSIPPKMAHVSRKRCVIIAGNDLIFGMARMYQQLSEGRLPYPIEIVRTEQECLQALGISAPSLATLLE